MTAAKENWQTNKTPTPRIDFDPCCGAERRLQQKWMTELYQTWQPWQRGLFLSTVIKHCSADQLARLRQILLPVGHTYTGPLQRNRNLDLAKLRDSVQHIMEGLVNQEETTLFRLETPDHFSTDTSKFRERVHRNVEAILQTCQTPINTRDLVDALCIRKSPGSFDNQATECHNDVDSGLRSPGHAMECSPGEESKGNYSYKQPDFSSEDVTLLRVFSEKLEYQLLNHKDTIKREEDVVRHVAETILCSPLTEALRSCHQPGLQHLITKQAMGVIAQTLNVPEHSEQLPEDDSSEQLTKLPTNLPEELEHGLTQMISSNTSKHQGQIPKKKRQSAIPASREGFMTDRYIVSPVGAPLTKSERLNLSSSLKAGSFLQHAGHNETVLESFNQKALGEENQFRKRFASQIKQISQLLDGWTSCDLSSLLVNLIKTDESQLTKLYRLIKRTASTLTINDLPDQLLSNIYNHLTASELRTCQQVCSRWRTLCTENMLWAKKCDQLGAVHGLPSLSDRVFGKCIALCYINWQQVYFQLEKTLHSSANQSSSDSVTEQRLEQDKLAQQSEPRFQKPPPVDIESQDEMLPKTADARGSLFYLESQGLLKPSTHPSTHSVNRKESKTGGTRSTRNENTDDSQADTSADLRELDNENSEPKRLRNLKREYKKVVKFPRLTLRGDTMAIADDRTRRLPSASTMQSSFTSFASHKSLRPGGAASSMVSIPEGTSVDHLNLRRTKRPGLSSGEPERGRIDVNVEDLVMTKLSVEEALGKIAIDVRTSLHPALALHTKSEFLAQHSTKLIREGVKSRTKFTGDIASPSKALKAAALTWSSPEQFNIHDPIERARFVGIVKPITLVDKYKGHLDSLHAVTFDKKRVFTAGVEAKIYLWDVRSGHFVASLTGHKGSVRSMQLNSEEDKLYSASWDTTIIVWDVVKLKPIGSMAGHTGVVSSIRLSSDGRMLCSASYDGSIRLWYTRTFSCKFVMHVHTGNIFCLWFDGHQAATGSDDGKVKLYDCKAPNGKLVQSFKADLTLKDTSSVANIAISSNQPWDTQIRQKYMLNGIQSVMVLNDLILGGTSHGELYCWDRNSGEAVAVFDIHIGAVTALRLWMGRILSSGSDGIIKEWELSTMTCVRTLHDHTEGILEMEADEKLERIISVGDDKLVHVWHFGRVNRKPKSLTVRTRLANNDAGLTSHSALQSSTLHNM